MLNQCLVGHFEKWDSEADISKVHNFKDVLLMFSLVDDFEKTYSPSPLVSFFRVRYNLFGTSTFFESQSLCYSR